MAEDSMSFPHRTAFSHGGVRTPRRLVYAGFLPLAAVALLTLGLHAVDLSLEPDAHQQAGAGMADSGMTAQGMAMAARPGNVRPGGITATTVSSETLAHVPGKAVTVQVVEFQPKAIAPEHHHAGSVTVYVLSGTIRSQLAGGPVITYTEGQTFFEPAGAVHVFAENPSATEKARIMAVHVADEGAELTTYH